jgi:hypothetical protein
MLHRCFAQNVVMFLCADFKVLETMENETQSGTHCHVGQLNWKFFWRGVQQNKVTYWSSESMPVNEVFVKRRMDTKTTRNWILACW